MNLRDLLNIKKIKKNDYIKDVIILFSGSVFAQALPILVSPVLTRVYRPEDFGLLAIFTSVVMTIAPAVSGKYEIALMLPKNDSDGKELLGISMGFTFIISAILFVALYFFSGRILEVLNAEKLSGWILITPFALFFTGLMTALCYYANRKCHYGNMSKARIVKDGNVALMSVVLGVAGLGLSGLLFGYICGTLFSAIYLFFIYRKEIGKDFFTWNRSKKRLMKKYKDYPLYNATSSLLDGITVSMPIFFISYYFNTEIIGYFSLVTRIAAAPLSFISAAVSQVNLKNVIDHVHQKKDIQAYILKVTKGLVLLVIIPVLFLVMFSPVVFVIVFGEDWRTAGYYMQVLIPAIGIKFIATTLSTTIGATQSNHLGMIWKCTAFVVSLIVFLIVAPKRDVFLLLKTTAAMDIGLYLFYYFLIWKAAGNPKGID